MGRISKFLEILGRFLTSNFLSGVIQEHSNAQGRALALVNNGKYINLTSVSIGDVARNWNDEASSAIVKSN